jgi:hypothetical protein
MERIYVGIHDSRANERLLQRSAEPFLEAEEVAMAAGMQPNEGAGWQARRMHGRIQPRGQGGEAAAASPPEAAQSGPTCGA